jgi:hypothetical protein
MTEGLETQRSIGHWNLVIGRVFGNWNLELGILNAQARSGEFFRVNGYEFYV